MPRRRIIVILCALLAVSGPAGFEIGTARTALAQPDVITVTMQTPNQPAYQWQGFGTSLAWWANIVGGFLPAKRSQIEDALFGTSTPQDPNRLGLNVLRYNIGASPTTGNPPVADSSRLPGFCNTWNFGDAVPAVQNGPGQPILLAQDTNQINVLTEAISRIQAAGVRPVLQAFANSAPWWMTGNGCPQGDGSLILGVPVLVHDNLTQYANYAQYLTDVLSAFRTQKGITFDSVEPLNEPTDPWVPGLNGGQEGMQVSRSSTSTSSNPQDSILSDLCVALSQEQLTVSVAAPDGFNPDGTSSFPVAPPDNTLADLNSYGQSTRNCLGQVDTHMYNLGIDFSLGWPPVKGDLGSYVGAGRINLAAAAAKLSPGAPPRMWMSEFGNGGDGRAATSATALSTQIARDIRYLRPSAWVYWQAIEKQGGWGLIEAPGSSWAFGQNPGNAPLGPNFPNAIEPGNITPTKRFFALEQYSRFVHPGDWIVSSVDPQKDILDSEQATTTSAYDPAAQTLTIVTTNDTNSPQQPSYDISAFAPVGSNASVQVYRTDATSNVTPDSQPFHVADGQFTDLQTPNSVNTYVITLPGPPPGTGPGGVPGAPVNQPPVVSAGPDVTVPETQTITLTGSATDPDGDPLRVRWTAAPATGTTDPNASCTFVDPANLQTGITCSDEGDYKVTLTADDGFTLPVSSSATVHVTNLGPAIGITSPSPWQAFRAPASLSLIAPIADSGGHDTHTCTINWDDGSPPETFAHEGSCDRTHAYTAPGIYTITATVTDDDQHSVTASVIAVVYDPAGGRVTGGGWIDSPPGAYTANPSVVGKVHFTFQASYPAGTTTPTGNISVRLQDINLSMDATSLDWLVVAPNGEAAVKGTGTMGTQQVRFILYGYQGCGGSSSAGCQPGPDAFRAVIWPASQGANPTAPFLYNNVPGGDLELADAAPQPLGGGNIQTHP